LGRVRAGLQAESSEWREAFGKQGAPDGGDGDKAGDGFKR